MKKFLLLPSFLIFTGVVFSQSYYYTYTAGKTKFAAVIEFNKTPKSGEKKWAVTVFDIYDRTKTLTESTDDPLEIYPYLVSAIIKIDKAKMRSTLFNDPNREVVLQDLFNKFGADVKANNAPKPAGPNAPPPVNNNPTATTNNVSETTAKADTFTKRITIDSSYVIYIFKSNDKMTITVCNETDNKSKPDPCFSQAIDATIAQADFKTVVKNLLLKHYAKPRVFDETVDAKIGDIYTEWKEEKVKKEEKKKSDEEKEELKQRLKAKDSLLNALAAEDVDAATLILKDTVLVIALDSQRKTKKWATRRKEYMSLLTVPAEDMDSQRDKYLVIDSVIITTQNNTFNQLDIAGKIDGEEVNTITNIEYGLPFRRFIDGGEFIQFRHRGVQYILLYTELFTVRPGNRTGISYILRDSVYVIHAKRNVTKPTPLTIKRMRFLDFISASAFIDLFSLNNQNTNKNLNTEINIGFPLNHSSLFKRIPKFGGGYLVRQIGMNIWVASDIGDFSNNDTELTSYSLLKADASGNKTNTNYVNNFDLIKHSFLRINPTLNIASADIKRWNSFINFDFGLNWFASKIKYVDTLKKNDSLVSRTAFAFSPEVNFKWKINPTQNFAADLQIGYLWNLQSLTKEVVQVYGGENTQDLAERDRTNGWGRILKFELNFYFNPNISISNTVRGGWYIKTLYYKSLENVKNHFQFMVGYSSDVKRLFRY